MTAVGGAVAVIYRGSVVGPAVFPLQLLTARVTLGSLHLLGLEAVRLGPVVYHPAGFGYEISLGCTGIVPAVMLTTGVLAYRARAAKKLVGVLLGVPAILLLNLVRLVNLYVVGIGWPSAFDVMHRFVWEVVVILSVLALWLAWVVWAENGVSNAAPSAVPHEARNLPLAGEYEVKLGCNRVL